jgi:hypothetical protein
MERVNTIGMQLRRQVARRADDRRFERRDAIGVPGHEVARACTNCGWFAAFARPSTDWGAADDEAIGGASSMAG